MEKLITQKKLSILVIISVLFITALYFIFQNNSKENEKLFDIFLADLYNEKINNLDKKLKYLSNLDNPNVTFFSDLKLVSIENLDRYDKVDRDILLLKKALIDLDEQVLKSLSLDDDFIFNDLTKIYLLNSNTNNYKSINFDETELENFFIKSVYRLYNENN